MKTLTLLPLLKFDNINIQKKVIIVYIFFCLSTLLILGVEPGPTGFIIPDTDYPRTGTVYYASNTVIYGSDANRTGEENKPWNLQYALNYIYYYNKPNSTIVLHEGIYRILDRTNKMKGTIQPYPHKQVWIKGSTNFPSTGWVQSGSKWYRNNWTASFADMKDDNFTSSTYPLADYGDMVFINNIPLTQVATPDEVRAEKFCVDTVNHKLYVGSDPTIPGTLVEATVGVKGVFIDRSASGTIIRGIGMAHFAYRSITVNADDVTLENNVIVWNGFSGISYVDADRIIIRGNTFACNGSIGAEGFTSAGPIITHNIFRSNNIEHYAPGWHGGGIKILGFKSSNLIFASNIIENNFGIGLWLDENTTKASVFDNIFRFNTSRGIDIEVSWSNIIAFNTIYNNEMAGIEITDSSYIRVYNNTLVNNNPAIRVRERPRRNTPEDAHLGYDPEAAAAGISWETYSNEMVNNIIFNTKLSGNYSLINASEVLRPNQISFGTANGMIINSDYNAYFRPSIDHPNYWIKTGFVDSIGIVKISNYSILFSDFRTANPGFAVHSLALTAPAEPFFINADQNDFRLREGSLGLGRGANLPYDIAYICGRENYVGFLGSLGQYEFTGQPAICNEAEYLYDPENPGTYLFSGKYCETYTSNNLGLSGNKGVLFCGNEAGSDYVQFPIYVAKPGIYRIKYSYLNNTFRAKFQLYIDGEAQGPIVNQQDGGGTYNVIKVDLGLKVFYSSGVKMFKFLMTGIENKSGKYYGVFDRINLNEEAPQTYSYEAESLERNTSDLCTNYNYANLSSGQGVHFLASGSNDYVTFIVPVETPGYYRIKYTYLANIVRPIVQLSINGYNQGPEVNHQGQWSIVETDLGISQINIAGNMEFKFTMTGISANGAFVDMIDKITLIQIPPICSAPKADYDTSLKIMTESKEVLNKIGIRSPLFNCLSGKKVVFNLNDGKIFIRKACIQLFSMNGRKVNTFYSYGQSEIICDPVDYNGRHLPIGVYAYTIQNGETGTCVTKGVFIVIK